MVADTKEKVYYQRLLIAAGYIDREKGDDWYQSKTVLRFLKGNFSNVIKEFEEKFKVVAKNIRNTPLKNYRKPDFFEKCWRLARGPKPLTNWDYLYRAEPTSSGMLCEVPGEKEPVLIKPDDIPVDFSMENKQPEIKGAYDLYYLLGVWQRTLCALWAGILTRKLLGLARMVKEQRLALSFTGKAQDNLDSDISKKEDPKSDQPLGRILELNDISDKEARDFYKICDRAGFGSASCEDDAAEAFKKWFGSINIGILHDAGLSFKEAHLVLNSAGRRNPEMDIKLHWLKETGGYQFMACVKNKDTHGFDDPEKSSGIPESILFRFYQNTSAKAKKDFIRLLLREGLEKIQNLLRDGLVVHHLD